MKTTILLLILAALFGLSVTTRLPEGRNANKLYNLLKTRNFVNDAGAPDATATEEATDGEVEGENGQKKNGKCNDEKFKEYQAFQAMLAFESLAKQCELHKAFIDGLFDDSESSEETDNEKRRKRTIDENNGQAVPNEETVEELPEEASTLEIACPGVELFFHFYLEAPEEAKMTMVGDIAPHALIFQCAAMFAGWELDHELELDELVDEGPQEEAKAVESDLQGAEDAAGIDKRSKALRSLVTQLEKLLKSKKK